MNRTAVFFLLVIAPALCLVLASCTCSPVPPPTGDPIGDLVRRLNATNGMWTNGLSLDLDLSPDAEPGEILDEAIKLVGFNQGYIKTYQIQEIRQVQLGAGGFFETYSAALVYSDVGWKIVLFRLENNNRWWVRFYEVPGGGSA